MKRTVGILAVLLSLLVWGGNKAEAIEIPASENQWLLMSWEEVEVDLIEMIDPQNGGTEFLFKLSCEDESISSVTIENFLLNGNVRTDASVAMYLWDDVVVYESSDEVNAAAGMLGWDRITDMECDITVTSTEYETLHHETVSVPISSDQPPQIVMEPFHGIWAEEQVLSDTEQARITLLGCGKLLTASMYGDTFSGMLKIENLTERMLRIDSIGMSVNGIYTNMGIGRVIPGYDICFVPFELTNQELGEMGIESIFELKLQIITSESDRGRSSYDTSHHWFTIDLRGAVRSEQEFDEGTTIYDDGSLKIGYRGSDVSELWGVAYNWYLSVINDSDDDIVLRLCDVLLDDEETMDYITAFQLNSPILDDNEIGAHTKRYVKIEVDVEDGSPQPDLAFRLQVRLQKSYKVLYTTEDMIELSSDE